MEQLLSGEYLLWTIHPEAVLDEFDSFGVFRNSWEHSDPDFRSAYNWMQRQMSERAISNEPQPPVWAWRVWENQSKPRPDLRATCHLPTGTKGVRIEFRAPKEVVLLSDFDAWHSVLNECYCSESEEESLRIEKNGEPTKEMLEKSWERIFDLDFGCEEWRGKKGERMIQACMPYLKKNWIRKVDHFTAR